MRSHASISYLFNRHNFAQLTIEGGEKVSQFNDQNPVSLLAASLHSLYYKNHVYYIYNKVYAKATYSQDIANGLTLSGGFETARRSPLTVNTQYSIRLKDEVFNNNIPASENPVSGVVWNNNEDLHLMTLGISWTPALKYLSYPNFKSIEGSQYPTFSIRYQKAIPFGPNAVSFDKWRLKISKEAFKVGLMGYTELSVEYGSFLRRKKIHFIDFQHFNDSEILLTVPENYMRGFMQLRYYQYSTPNAYFMAHWQHHFDGYFLDKIPLVRKLGFKEIFRSAYLVTEDLKNYAEVGFGIDNIGWNIFRFFRVDVSWQFKDSAFNPKPKIRLGIKLFN